MPKHKAIRFENPRVPEKLKRRLEMFTKDHPLASSGMKVILALAAVGGVLTLAAVAPGIMGAFAKSIAREKREKRERYNIIWQNFYRLKKSRALELVAEKDNELIYRLTENGKVKLKNFLLETLEITSPRRWDRKWRVVVFDIPEKFRSARRAIQRKMISMGFYPMQKSVFAHPFPCEAEIEFLKNFFNIKPYIDVLLVCEMPNGKVIYCFKELLKKYI